MVRDTEERDRDVAEGRRVGEEVQKEVRGGAVKKREEQGRRKPMEENQ